MLPYEKRSDRSIFDIGLAFRNVLIPYKRIVETRRTKRRVEVTYPQHDVDEAVSVRLLPFLEELQQRDLLKGLISVFEHEEVEYYCTSSDQNPLSGMNYSKQKRKSSCYLHLKFNSGDMNKVLSVSNLLQQYCAEETVELQEDLDAFHSLHKFLPCDLSTRKRIELNFSNAKLVLLHISFVIDTGLLTTNKISIIESLFIEDSFRKKFALLGFVVHKGSLHSGHYIAYVVDADHNPLQWVSLDDQEGVTVVFEPSSFFENITSDNFSHVCLFIYGEISNELSNFHSEVKTECDSEQQLNADTKVNCLNASKSSAKRPRRGNENIISLKKLSSFFISHVRSATQ